MKLLIAGVLGYLGYRYLTREDFDGPPFTRLDSRTQDLLLRSYAQDYTSPRMISNDKLYDDAVNAANETGAPCGWVQFVLAQNPSINAHEAAVCMMKVCDDAVRTSSRIDLNALRQSAIDLTLATACAK